MPEIRVRPPDAYINHGLTNHRTATHTTKETTNHIRRTLSQTLFRRTTALSQACHSQD